MELKIENIKPAESPGEELFVVTFNTLMNKNELKTLLKLSNNHKLETID